MEIWEEMAKRKMGRSVFVKHQTVKKLRTFIFQMILVEHIDKLELFLQTVDSLFR